MSQKNPKNDENSKYRRKSFWISDVFRGYRNRKLILNRLLFNWDSLNARLNTRYKAWYYKKKTTEKMKSV